MRSAKALVAQWRPWLPLAVLLLLVVTTGVALGPASTGGPLLDPSSPGALGTRGLVEVLRTLGARVEVTGDVAGRSVTSALLLADDQDEAGRHRLEAWVREGGTLLLADPSSPLNPYSRVGGTAVGGVVQARLSRRCELRALAGVREVDAPDAVVFAASSGSTGCFPRNAGYWLVAAPSGKGSLVVVGGAGSFVNRRLGDADNAVLLAAVLAPRPGAAVAVLRPPPPGSGRRGLADLVAPRVKAGLWQLAIAFVVLALWRGRRLGRPVLEPRPVEVPGSELVVAVGHLLQRAGARERAAEVMRTNLRRRLAEWLGIPSTVPVDTLAELAAPRMGVARERLQVALAGPAPSTDTELVRIAQLVSEVQQDVGHA